MERVYVLKPAAIPELKGNIGRAIAEMEVIYVEALWNTSSEIWYRASRVAESICPTVKFLLNADSNKIRIFPGFYVYSENWF